jgi:hypothetical protein
MFSFFVVVMDKTCFVSLPHKKMLKIFNSAEVQKITFQIRLTS